MTGSAWAHEHALANLGHTTTVGRMFDGGECDPGSCECGARFDAEDDQ